MSLARDLIDAALQADLSQNELRVFLVLFRQTLCYGKTHDPLTVPLNLYKLNQGQVCD